MSRVHNLNQLTIGLESNCATREDTLFSYVNGDEFFMLLTTIPNLAPIHRIAKVSAMVTSELVYVKHSLTSAIPSSSTTQAFYIPGP